ncbi:hypothetical protein C0J52_23123 [Blattella germanica]|nr:hypothetical protein C0J52_23123 [Blattella germanica]
MTKFIRGTCSDMCPPRERAIPLVQRENLDWCVVYDFVFDRLRAVRQDLVVQGFDSRDCIRILEPIVLFHCYAGYRHALIVMSNAFSSRNLTFPLERLTSILLYKSEKQAALDCERCGINVRDGAVSFNKTAFKIDAKIACTKVACIDKALESLRLTQLLRLPSDPNSR